LIVEVRDHRPRGQSANTTSRGGPFITPSQNANTAPSRPATVQSKEPPRIYKTLLRPTEQSLWQDFGQLADTSGGEFTDWMGLQVEGGLMVSPLSSFLMISWRCIRDWCWKLHIQESLVNGYLKKFSIKQVPYHHGRKSNGRAARLLMILLNVLPRRNLCFSVILNTTKTFNLGILNR